MNRILKIFLVCIVIISAMYIFQKLPGEDNIQIKSNTGNITASLKFKGLHSARDFTFDEKGNCYIAFKNKIQIIDNTGKSYELLKCADINIASLCFMEKRLYYSSDTKIYCFALDTGKNAEIIKDIPNLGDYKESIIKTKGDNLYISIGAATNSGVVGEDNVWKDAQPYFHDITPNLITLKGINFGQDKTGAFQSYKTKSINGQIVSGCFPGNASIMVYNVKTGEGETFAFGIRNIKGMDFTREGKLAASVGGIENRGLRPVIGDSDYIYEIEKGMWYGWPDYSGGDPVNSPRFKGKNGGSISAVLENHPNTNPPAPRYQSNAVDEIGEVAVDSKGILGDKNAVYFYKKGSIYSLDTKNTLRQEFILPLKSKSCKMKFYNNELFVLDSLGNIFLIKSKFT